MRFRPLKLAGAFELELEPHTDERGFFARTFCSEEFTRAGLVATIVQTSISHNRVAATLRGMHWQAEPHQETKVVACERGSIYDVLLDVRDGSDTWGQWVAVWLDADRRNAVYIPAGIAHGFQTMVDDAVVSYAMSTQFAPASARGLRWDDPAFAIDWPAAPSRTISERDRSYPLWESRRL